MLASVLSSTTPSPGLDAPGRSFSSRPRPEASPATSLGEPGSSCRPLSLRQPDLERQAREFAGDLTELLNGTVTHGVRLRSYMDRRGRAVVGYRVSEANAVGEGIPLTVSKSSAHLYLSVLHTLELDDSGTLLTTSRSTYTLQGHDAASILTYDFVREPPNEFPEAHIHVHGPRLGPLCGGTWAGYRCLPRFPGSMCLPHSGQRTNPGFRVQVRHSA